MKSIISKIINILSIILMIAAVLVLVSTIMTSKGDVPSIGGYSAMRVVSGSMEPEIKTNSLIVIKRLDSKTPEEIVANIKEGDIIAFYSSDPDLDGMTVTHRVVRIDTSNGEPMYITKGDANASEDETPVYCTSIIGKVVWKSHIFGIIVKLILNPLVFFPFIILPLVIMIILNLRDSVKSTKEIMKQEEEEAIRQALEEIKNRKEKSEDEENE